MLPPVALTDGDGRAHTSTVLSAMQPKRRLPVRAPLPLLGRHPVRRKAPVGVLDLVIRTCGVHLFEHHAEQGKRDGRTDRSHQGTNKGPIAPAGILLATTG